MRLSRILFLVLAATVVVAWLGLSAGVAYHHHDDELIHSDCPWCSVANSPPAVVEIDLGPGNGDAYGPPLSDANSLFFSSSELLASQTPRAPPSC